ncbi:hypothetical protein BKA62DRAFT_694578 [Auriculariales sp. MPI-PUGE-AT-0066]|nr:hypothetical protein BKA62DRAFT_694578 [Auriculariales sp. MPI-PUGE-AT-0066]
MLELQGFRAAVLVDGKRLDTYEPSINGNTISGWIASEVGKGFTIQMEQTTNGFRPNFNQRTEIDGKEIDHTCAGPDSFTLKGMRPTPTTFTTLQFAALQTTEDQEKLDVKADPNLGTIRLTLNRRLRTGSGELSRIVMNTPKAEVVHEQNKKLVLGGQTVGTGAVSSVEPVRYALSTPYNLLDAIPYVTFVFKYRSREFLEAQEIVPRAAATSPANSKPPAASSSSSNPRKRPADDTEVDVKPAKKQMLSVDRMDKRAKRMQDLKNELRNLEAEEADDLGVSPPPERKPFPFGVGQRKRPVKREVSPIQVRVGDDGIIDLTSD